MKTHIYILTGVILMSLATISCTKDILMDVEKPEIGGWHSASARFLVVCNDFDSNGSATRGTDSYSWKDGDVIHLLLTDKNGNKVQAYVKYDEDIDDWGDIQYDGYKSYLTCTEPRNVEAFFVDGPVTTQEDKVMTNAFNAVYTCIDGSYTYPSNGELCVKISLKPITSRIRFQGEQGNSFTVNGIKYVNSYSLTTGVCEFASLPVSAKIESGNSSPYLYYLFNDTKDPTLKIRNDKTYKTVFDSSITILSPGKSGFMRLPTNDDHRGWIILVVNPNGHDYVDLGLTSGILWATCNVGASSPSAYGYYYAWGETKTKNTYTSSNHTYTGTPATLPLDRDAARVCWGGDWRLPTKEECEELVNECTWEWSYMNGRYGAKGISKKNGNTIFLPAAGIRGSSLDYQGENGEYWASSLASSTPYKYAYFLGFNVYAGSNISINGDGIGDCYSGRCIRPVIAN